jgi:hypothetical protein
MFGFGEWCLSRRQPASLTDLPSIMLQYGLSSFLSQSWSNTSKVHKARLSILILLVVGACYPQSELLKVMVASVSVENTRAASNDIHTTIVDVFDPFTDIRVNKLPVIHSPQHHGYSSFRCVESPYGKFDSFTSRTCLFHNLYYHGGSKSFHYFASLPESRGSVSSIEERIAVVSGFLHKEAGPNKINAAMQNTKWLPKVHTNETLPTSVASIEVPTNPIFLLFKLSYSFNFGHYMFDDALSLFTMLDFFGYMEGSRQQSYQMIPLPVTGGDPFWRCQTRWHQCNKMLRKVMPAILGIAFQNETTLLTTDNLGRVLDTNDDNSSEWLLLPTVIVGTGRVANFGCSGDCTIHRTSALPRFRRWMLQNLFGPVNGNYRADQAATTGKITVSLPIGNSHDWIQTFDEIVPALREKFGSDNVHVYDMATLTIQEQADVVSQSQVLLSNAGGGSASSLFLPRGSTLLLYYKEGTQFDHELYSSLGYFQTNWLLADAAINTTLSLVESGLQTPVF